jgi:hypothetical protein
LRFLYYRIRKLKNQLAVLIRNLGDYTVYRVAAMREASKRTQDWLKKNLP